MSKFKKILVIGGVHGDETTGIELIKKLEQKPIKTISTLLANPLAVQKKKRFIETDLNRSFNKVPISKEEKLALEIDKEIRNYDLILNNCQHYV
jgi:aspartoacylase